MKGEMLWCASYRETFTLHAKQGVSDFLNLKEVHNSAQGLLNIVVYSVNAICFLSSIILDFIRQVVTVKVSSRNNWTKN